jgi:hypothetical protein
MNDLVDPPRVHANVVSQAVLADPQRLQELLQQDLTGVDGGKSPTHACLLVVVCDLNVVSVSLAPTKADAPLIVDANTVLSFAIAG